MGIVGMLFPISPALTPGAKEYHLVIASIKDDETFHRQVHVACSCCHNCTSAKHFPFKNLNCMQPILVAILLHHQNALTF